MMETFTASEENLAARPGVRVEVSVDHPTGRASRNPNVLLSDPPAFLDGQPLSAFLRYRDKTYDTYDGHNIAHKPDWYAIHFPQAITCNCIEMTMECPNRDGGWWVSLHVEYWDEGSGWQPVSAFEIAPPYPFDDEPLGRLPYQSHALTFNEVTTEAVRIIGKPGGLAQFTSLAHLAVYERDLSRWNPASLPAPPLPYIFRLIPPQTIWDISESMVKLTGLAVYVAYMDHYLDPKRYARWWKHLSHNYLGEPELWQLIGDSIGWDNWNRLQYPDEGTLVPREPYVRISFHNSIGQAVAPIIVDQQVLGEIASHQVIIRDQFDQDWHRHYAREHHIAWRSYAASIERSPRMSLEQLDGAATLMGMIANTIANLAHRNLKLESELDGVRGTDHREIVRKAIDFMQDNLEAPVSVGEVAQAVALNPTYFGIIFSEQIGRNPIDYLIDLRIERAKHYLGRTQMSVMDVCVALGYNPSYFSRLFKRRMGCTPGEYARRIHE
ncbi:MAG: helix-turn-helix domain-containing protein [Chloroflexi bacterium]|nr:helix-turn-helix domain-containing protein [Chloroflexota bacterium]